MVSQNLYLADQQLWNKVLSSLSIRILILMREKQNQNARNHQPLI